MLLCAPLEKQLCTMGKKNNSGTPRGSKPSEKVSWLRSSSLEGEAASGIM